MSYSLMGGQGMGAAGTGAGQSPAMPASGGLSPQLLMMLRAMSAGQQQPGAGGVAPAPGPTMAPATGTPMASMIGGGGNPAMMQRPPMPVPGAAPQIPGMNTGQPGAPTSAPGQMPAGGGMNPQMLQMINAMRGSQTGVPATPPPAQGPQHMQPPPTALGATAASGAPAPPDPNAQPGWLQSLINSIRGPQQSPY